MNFGMSVFDLGVVGATSIMPQRDQLRSSYFSSRQNFLDGYNSVLQNHLGADLNSNAYQICRGGTPNGIELGLAVIGIGALKKAIFNKSSQYLAQSVARNASQSIATSTQLARISAQTAGASEALGSGLQLNRFHQAARNLSEVGQNNVRILRGWAKSKGWSRHPNFNGGPEKWGTFSKGEFEWNLRIKPEASFRPGLESGSNYPRFDARLGNDSSYIYMNPFTGAKGSKNIGTHIPLE